MSESEIGPSRISFPIFILKILAGGAGGIIGSLILLVIFLLSGTIATQGEELNLEFISPIFIFLILIMIFLSSTVGNIISSLLLSFTEKEKYKRRSTAIYQIFIVNIIIFLLMTPIYFLAAAINIQIIAYAIAIHVIITAQVSALILEIISNNKYALVGVYGVSFSVIGSAAILFGMANIITSPQILLFFTLPIVWATVAAGLSFVTIIYGALARTYDKDFLATETEYGNDYGETDMVSADEGPVINEDGADFLRKSK